MLYQVRFQGINLVLSICLSHKFKKLNFLILNFAEHINKPEKEIAKKTEEQPTVEATINDPSIYCSQENSSFYVASKEDNSQSNIVIGISVGIAVVSLVAMFLLIMDIVSKRKKKHVFSNNYDNQITTPQFKIVPINRSNLKSSRFQPPSNFSDLTGCFPNEAKDTSIQGSEFTDCSEFNYYDYTNNRVDGCYGNGGTVVHV